MGCLDPGLFGLLSQVGLAVFLVAVSALTVFFKPIKKLFLRIIKGKRSIQTEIVSDHKDVID